MALSAFGQNKTESVFADGTVYQMTVPFTGIYKVTYQQIADNTDIDVASINPKNIHIYGNPGGLLPLENSLERVDDLAENTVFVSGEDDNSFDPGDFVLFYAEGGDRLRNTGSDLVFEKNVYDPNNYYYLKVENTPGLRILTTPSVASNSYSPHSDVLIRHEDDRENLLAQFVSTQGSGQNWFGETFTNQRSQDFSSFFDNPNIVVGQPATISLAFAARSETRSEVALNVNGLRFTENLLSVDLGNIESLYADAGVIEQTFQTSNNMSISVDFEPTSNDSQGWLDYIQLRTRQWNRINSQPILLYDTSSVSSSTFGFSIENAGNDLMVWDISSHGNVTNITPERAGNDFEFGYNTSSSLSTFAAFDLNGEFQTPTFNGVIENQNLHALERVDMVILYYSESRQAAFDLAEHRRANDGLVVIPVNINHVYNEFAGGKQDPVAIRDMMRMLHLRDDNFRYLLLLGDASYDYRGIYDNVPKQNFIPTFQTTNSIHPLNAYPTDDYFGLLSEDEGSASLTGTLDIATGRIPSKSSQEAQAVVDKIIHYDTNPSRFGDWRSTVGFGADDVDAAWDTVHLRDTDAIAENLRDENPCIDQEKVYWDSFVQEATPGGARYPTANQALTDNINKGNLVFTYLGHGGPNGLSQERVLQISDVSNWNNIDNLTLFITATCSFTGFDEPDIVSAGEHLMLNPNGGAVAIFTTVRSVFASQNRLLTESVYENLFERVDGLPRRLGDILTTGKNGLTESSTRNITNTRKFLLIGDPSMTLALPSHNVSVTGYNGEEIEIDTSQEARLDTLGALGRASIQGEITRFNDGSLISASMVMCL